MPIFKDLTTDKISKIADVLEEAHYNDKEYICRQDARGATFYIIAKGKVQFNIIHLTATINKYSNFSCLYFRNQERYVKTPELKSSVAFSKKPV